MTFQFTTSHGGRLLWIGRGKKEVGSFNSRPHTEVDLPYWAAYCLRAGFQFTTSHGGRHMVMHGKHMSMHLSIHDLTRRSTFFLFRCPVRLHPFNSRPHTEVDSMLVSSFRFVDLSIHDLTRRSTRERPPAQMETI